MHEFQQKHFVTNHIGVVNYYVLINPIPDTNYNNN